MGVHYCVHRPENNCEPLEMMGGYTIVSTGFWGKFFSFFIIALNYFPFFVKFDTIFKS